MQLEKWVVDNLCDASFQQYPVNVAMAAIYEARNKIIVAVLKQLLNREPTQDDFEKVQLRTTFGRLGTYHFMYDGHCLGTIKEAASISPMIEKHYRPHERFVLYFTPSETYR